MQPTNSVHSSTVMASNTTAISFTTAVGFVAGTSRQLWVFARDRGVPGWRIVSKVSVGFLEFLKLTFFFNTFRFIRVLL